MTPWFRNEIKAKCPNCLMESPMKDDTTGMDVWRPLWIRSIREMVKDMQVVREPEDWDPTGLMSPNGLVLTPEVLRIVEEVMARMNSGGASGG